MRLEEIMNGKMTEEKANKSFSGREKMMEERRKKIGEKEKEKEREKKKKNWKKKGIQLHTKSNQHKVD